jgi:hypothetical protein
MNPDLLDLTASQLQMISEWESKRGLKAMLVETSVPGVWQIVGAPL